MASCLLLVLPLQAQLVDDFRLIDINNLEQLYAIRYDMNGDGAPDEATTDEEKAVIPYCL